MNPNAFSLILSCGGLKYNDMVLCSSTANVIINFDKHFDESSLDKIMDFLDSGCNLFDRPIIDWNKIINVLKILRERYDLINDTLWSTLHIWLPQHKKCGAVLQLCLNSKLSTVLSNEQFITSTTISKK